MQLILDQSTKFWAAMEQADEAGMRAVADPNCGFVHIGMTCKLDEEIECYTSGAFKPTEIVFHDKRRYSAKRPSLLLTVITAFYSAASRRHIILPLPKYMRAVTIIGSLCSLLSQR